MNYQRKLSNYLSNKPSYADPAKVAVALLTGLAVGAILGVLFAPESGEETRYRIADKAKDLANNAKDKYQSVKNKLEPTLNNLADKKDDIVSAVKSKFGGAAIEAEDAASKIAEQAKSKIATVSVDQNGSINGI